MARKYAERTRVVAGTMPATLDIMQDENTICDCCGKTFVAERAWISECPECYCRAPEDILAARDYAAEQEAEWIAYQGETQ